MSHTYNLRLAVSAHPKTVREHPNMACAHPVSNIHHITSSDIIDLLSSASATQSCKSYVISIADAKDITMV